MELEKQGRYTLSISFSRFPDLLDVIYQGKKEHFGEEYLAFNIEGKAMVLLLKEQDIAAIQGPRTIGTF